MTLIRTYASPALELRLVGAESDVSAFSRSPRLRTVLRDRHGWRRIQSKFFDTPDQTLATRGACLEVRLSEDGARQIFTWTSGAHLGPVGAFEAPLTGEGPDLQALLTTASPGETAAGVLRMADGQLECVGEILSDQWSGVAFIDGGAIETTIDVGRAARLDRNGEAGRAAIAEIKLSLLKGGARTLFSFARDAVANSGGRLRLAARRSVDVARAAGLPTAIGRAPKVNTTEDFAAADVLSAGVAASAWRLIDLAPFLMDDQHPEAARQARVALGDGIAVALKAQTVVVALGERPGLSAADSLGVYITHRPRIGMPDSARNCLSNIREGGMDVESAAERAMGLIRAMRSFGESGVALSSHISGGSLPGPG